MRNSHAATRRGRGDEQPAPATPPSRRSSCEEPSLAERLQDDLLERRARRRRGRSRGCSGRRSARAPSACCSHASLYARASAGVTSTSRSSPVSASTNRTSPSAPGSRSRMRRDVHDEHVVAHRRAASSGRVSKPCGIEKIRDDDGQALLAGCATANSLNVSRRSVGPPVSSRSSSSKTRKMRPLPAAGHRSRRASVVAERQDRHAIEVREADVAERRRDPPRLIELRRLAPSIGSRR